MKNVGVTRTPLACALATSASTRALPGTAPIALAPAGSAQRARDFRHVVLGQRRGARHQRDVRVPERRLVGRRFGERGGAARDVAAGQRAVPEHVAQPVAEAVAQLRDLLVGRAAVRAGVAAVLDQRQVRALGPEHMVAAGFDRAVQAMRPGSLGHGTSERMAMALKGSIRGAGRPRSTVAATCFVPTPRGARADRERDFAVLLQQAAIFLVTAVIVVPLFRRLKLGAVLGYLAAGAIIGPWGLGLIADSEETLHFAELGVVLLLFLVGLELEPSRLWALRKPVFGLGGAQVAGCGLVLAGAAHALGLAWEPAIVVGFGLAMSSTAIVLAWLGERGQLSEPAGRRTFAVLLFQDLAVIPLIALLPLLSPEQGATTGGWLMAAKGLAAIAVVIIGSRLVTRPVLKVVARYGGREVFTAAALLVVIGAALIMDAIGLSMSLGAFLAGVLLADSEFRHELEADVEPFKGLLMGLFFIAVGMSANLALFVAQPLQVLGVAVGLLVTKGLLMYAIARIAGAGNADAQRMAVWLAQGGEFAFVLFAAAFAGGILTGAVAQFLVLAVTVSMLLAPLSFVLHERLLARWLERSAPPEFDTIDGPGNPVIIAGYGRYGQIVSRVLRMAGIPFTAIELDYQQVDFVRRFGNKVYYGDASRLELLESAKARDAKLFVLAIDDIEASLKTAALVRKHFPNLPILARARNRVHLYRLRDLDIDAIERETFRSSLETAKQALVRTGMAPEQAARAVALFETHDAKLLDAQYAVRQDEQQFIQTSAQAAAQLQELFEADVKMKVG